MNLITMGKITNFLNPNTLKIQNLKKEKTQSWENLKSLLSRKKAMWKSLNFNKKATLLTMSSAKFRKRVSSTILPSSKNFLILRKTLYLKQAPLRSSPRENSWKLRAQRKRLKTKVLSKKRRSFLIFRISFKKISLPRMTPQSFSSSSNLHNRLRSLWLKTTRALYSRLRRTGSKKYKSNLSQMMRKLLIRSKYLKESLKISMTKSSRRKGSKFSKRRGKSLKVTKIPLTKLWWSLKTTREGLTTSTDL